MKHTEKRYNKVTLLKVKTNFDTFKEKSIDELTELLAHDMCCSCCIFEDYLTCNGECHKGVKQYLESKA